jgi:hypothetical protein
LKLLNILLIIITVSVSALFVWQLYELDPGMNMIKENLIGFGLILFTSVSMTLFNLYFVLILNSSKQQIGTYTPSYLFNFARICFIVAIILYLGLLFYDIYQKEFGSIYAKNAISYLSIILFTVFIILNIYVLIRSYKFKKIRKEDLLEAQIFNLGKAEEII